jgi:hypothetical protein
METRACETPFPVSFSSAPRLCKDSLDYLNAQQQIPHRAGGHYDRSAEEQRIFTTLMYQGWSDEQIVAFR